MRIIYIFELTIMLLVLLSQDTTTDLSPREAAEIKEKQDPKLKRPKMAKDLRTQWIQKLKDIQDCKDRILFIEKRCETASAVKITSYVTTSQKKLSL